MNRFFVSERTKAPKSRIGWWLSTINWYTLRFNWKRTLTHTQTYCYASHYKSSGARIDKYNTILTEKWEHTSGETRTYHSSL